jgi:hypothetical protein
MQGECPLIRMLDAIPYVFDITVDDVIQGLEFPNDHPRAILERIRDVLAEQSGARLTLSTIFFQLAKEGRFVDDDDGWHEFVSDLILCEAEEEERREKEVNRTLDIFMTAPKVEVKDPWKRAVKSVSRISRVPRPKNPPKCATVRPVW